MENRTTRRVARRQQYRMHLQIGLAIVLLLLIGAFKSDLQHTSDLKVDPSPPVLIETDTPPQTDQRPQKPPPLRPPVLQEVPNDEVLDDDPLHLDAMLDIDEVLEIPAGPTQSEEKTYEETQTFQLVEEMPEPIGGLASILNQITYPEIAKKAGVEGTVFVQFVVSKTGEVKDVVVLKGIGAGCDEEAVRAVMNTRFKPGLQRGKPVQVRMSVPVVFRLK